MRVQEKWQQTLRGAEQVNQVKWITKVYYDKYEAILKWFTIIIVGTLDSGYSSNWGGSKNIVSCWKTNHIYCRFRPNDNEYVLEEQCVTGLLLPL